MRRSEAERKSRAHAKGSMANRLSTGAPQLGGGDWRYRDPLAAKGAVLLVWMAVLAAGQSCQAPYEGEKRPDQTPLPAAGQSSLEVESAYNYAEALQRAIYFYECQQAGPLADWNRVEWRGDSTMSDGVVGGLYDAGDHVKFNLPLSYTASMLGWALYEYETALTTAGQKEHLRRTIEFILSYLMACWDGNNYVFQVGNGGNDHSWWGPVEVIEKESTAGSRPVLSTTTGASCVMAQSAAELALGHINLGGSGYLLAAEQLFARAYNQGNPSDDVYKASDAGGYYNSWSGPWDEVQWAAIWLHVATGDPEYLAIAESAVPHLNRQGQSNDIEYKWGQVWDDSHLSARRLLRCKPPSHSRHRPPVSTRRG